MTRAYVAVQALLCLALAGISIDLWAKGAVGAAFIATVLTLCQAVLVAEGAA